MFSYGSGGFGAPPPAPAASGWQFGVPVDPVPTPAAGGGGGGAGGGDDGGDMAADSPHPAAPGVMYYGGGGGGGASGGAPGGGVPPAPPSSLGDLPPAEGLFGMLVAGRPVSMDFRAAEEGKYVAEVPAPGDASELSVFLLPGVALPPDRGIVLVFAVPPFTEWRPLGTLAPNRPSGVFRTGWPSDPTVASAPVVLLGLSVEPVDAVESLSHAAAAAEWDKLGFTQLVARDLFTYLQSFAQMTAVGERLVIPADALDRWMRKFEDKFRRDPNFLVTRAAAGSV